MRVGGECVDESEEDRVACVLVVIGAGKRVLELPRTLHPECEGSQLLVELLEQGTDVVSVALRLSETLAYSEDVVEDQAEVRPKRRHSFVRAEEEMQELGMLANEHKRSRLRVMDHQFHQLEQHVVRTKLPSL